MSQPLRQPPHAPVRAVWLMVVYGSTGGLHDFMSRLHVAAVLQAVSGSPDCQSTWLAVLRSLGAVRIGRVRGSGLEGP